MADNLLGYLAVDQYGESVMLTNPKHPRKQLLEKTGGANARKMYVDDKDGNTKHIGYIVCGHWWTIYKVNEWKGLV